MSTFRDAPAAMTPTDTYEQRLSAAFDCHFFCIPLSYNLGSSFINPVGGTETAGLKLLKIVASTSNGVDASPNTVTRPTCHQLNQISH